MSIGYEEALETLQSMFGDKWTRDGLDTVLRHHQGHMENTVDMILRHGDAPPEALLEQIQRGIDPRAQSAAMDEALARQLSQSGRGATTSTAAATSSTKPRGRGTPTILPEEFLRLPNGMNFASNNNQMSDDEALARMLQDQMFSEEMSRNPDLAHLARGRPRTAGGMPTAAQRGRVPAGASAGGGGGQPPDLEAVKHALGNLGNSAKRQFQSLAAQFNAKMRQAQTIASGGGGAAAGAGGAAGGGGGGANAAGLAGAHERRGLLDDHDDDGDEVAFEFAQRKDL